MKRSACARGRQSNEENLGEFDDFLFGLSSFANPLLESYEQLLGGLATQPVGSRSTQATQSRTHHPRRSVRIQPAACLRPRQPGRVVKAKDLKSFGVPPHRFEPCGCRWFFFAFFHFSPSSSSNSNNQRRQHQHTRSACPPDCDALRVPSAAE